MNLDISLATEARLAAKAQERGVSAEVLLKQLLDEADDTSAKPPKGEFLGLPVWHLGVRGSLHRRDIYDDID